MEAYTFKIEMDCIYEKLVKPIFFKQDPEKIHELAIKAMHIIGSIAPLRAAMEKFNLVRDEKPTEIFGVEFPNKIGLAAGFDKEALAWRAAAAFGFGHLEIGTISMHKQSGNPKPRIFRYPEEAAIVNSCGFPNDGAEAIAARLRKVCSKKTKKIPLGINIGKSKVTPLEEAAKDYIFSYNALAEFADFFVINVSSPNTPELRKLQGASYLPELLKAIKEADSERAAKFGIPKIPILLKIAPDLSFREIDSILEIVSELKIDGMVATNTTVTRPQNMDYMVKTGGLSGKPLFGKSLEIVSYICKKTEGAIPVIGVGGIHDTECAAKMLDAGASLVQIYSSFIFNGPFFARELAKSLAWRCGRDWV